MDASVSPNFLFSQHTHSKARRFRFNKENPAKTQTRLYIQQSDLLFGRNPNNRLDAAKVFWFQTGGEYFADPILTVHHVHPLESLGQDIADDAVVIFNAYFVRRWKLLGQNALDFS
ncbi:MAG TPA: hypothetical protein DDY78_17660 [Planctomycetales bacterium]|nr:hypothetical protein [Planctomycetales bacterium]